jgi:hypothetical protein
MPFKMIENVYISDELLNRGKNMDEIKVLSPNGGLGAGFPKESFENGLKNKPDVIALDAGSSDPGPYYLGAGVATEGKNSIKRDLEALLLAQQQHKIPIITGSATTTGAKPNLEWTIDIAKEIAKEKGYHFKLAKIAADIDKEMLKKALANNKIKTFETGKALTAEEIDKSTRIVAQMGVEPFIEALKLDADVIIAGRAYDPAVIAAYPIYKGFDKGLAIHMGKILECGCMACDPPSGFDVLMGTIKKDCFELTPMNEKRSCTTTSVAAHTLYEKDNPIKLALPGGLLDLTGTKFAEIGNRTVKVTGSKFIEQPYTVKLEGAKKVGYRTIFIAGVRDPITIQHIDEIINAVKKEITEQFSYLKDNPYQIIFHVYGKNGVMGDLEPVKTITSHELGIVGEVIAANQEIANEICGQLYHHMLHYDYPGRKATAGNLAFLYSPQVVPYGEVYEFNIYHLLEVDDPVSLFPITIEEI